jgi:sulfur relay (sulfurtransferase) DsrC/TusE family protein
MSSTPANDNNNNQNQGAQQQQQIKKLPCDHIFHKNCLRSWFQRQQTCPTCRTSILRMSNQNQHQQQMNAQAAQAAQAQAPAQVQPQQVPSQPQQINSRSQQVNTPGTGLPSAPAQSSPRLAQSPSVPIIQSPVFSLNSPSTNLLMQPTSQQSNETNPLLNNLFSMSNLPLPPFGMFHVLLLIKFSNK